MSSPPAQQAAYVQALLGVDPKDAARLVQKRFRDAAVLTSELAEYFSARRAVEASHARALARLARRPLLASRASAPPGLNPLLDALVGELDALAQIHRSREQAVALCEHTARDAPSLGAWAGLPGLQEQLQHSVRDLVTVQSNLARQERKFNVHPEEPPTPTSMTGRTQAQRLDLLRNELYRASAEWHQTAQETFQCAYQADAERLTLIKDIVTQFEAGSASTNTQLTSATGKALQASLAVDVDQETLSFARTMSVVPMSVGTAGSGNGAPLSTPREAVVSPPPIRGGERLGSGQGSAGGTSSRSLPRLRAALDNIVRRRSSQEPPTPTDTPVQSPNFPAVNSEGNRRSGSLIRRGRTFLARRRTTKLLNRSTAAPSQPYHATPPVIREDSPLSSEEGGDRGQAAPGLLSEETRTTDILAPLPPLASHSPLSPPLLQLTGTVITPRSVYGSGSSSDARDSVQYRAWSPVTPPTTGDHDALQSLRGTLPPLPLHGLSPRRRSPSPLAVQPSGNKVGTNPPYIPSNMTGDAASFASLLASGCLQIKITEKVNAHLEQGNISRHLVAGVIEAQIDLTTLPPGTNLHPVTVRIDHMEDIDRIVPNSVVFRPVSPPSGGANGDGLYVLNPVGISERGGAQLAKYLVRLDPQQQQKYTPLTLQPQWRAGANHLDLLLSYTVSKNLDGLTVETHLAPGPVESMQSLPEGTWDTSTCSARWSLQPSTTAAGTAGILRARWFGQASPQPLTAAFSAICTLSGISLSVLDEEGEGDVGNPLPLPTTRSCAAGTYVAT